MDPAAETVVAIEPPPAAAAVSEAADAAVEIAQIEADRDVAIAELNAGMVEAAADAAADDFQDDVQWLKATLEDLRAQCAAQAASSSALEVLTVELSNRLSAMETQLTTLAAVTIAEASDQSIQPPSVQEVIPEATSPGDVAAGQEAESVVQATDQAVQNAKRRLRFL